MVLTLKEVTDFNQSDCEYKLPRIRINKQDGECIHWLSAGRFDEWILFTVVYKRSTANGKISASILYKSTADRYRPVSYPDGPITARCRFIKNAYWDAADGYWSHLQ